MESKVFFRRPGFEYRYRIGMDEDIISFYEEELERVGDYYGRSFILEVRTNFILKKTTSDEGEEIIGSERFASIDAVNLSEIASPVNEVVIYTMSIDYRLEEYWLPENEIERIAREASYFVKRSAAADPRLDVIPVVVYLDVCTVQLEGELLDATVVRSIKPDCLTPIQFSGTSIVQLADGGRPKNSLMLKEVRAMSTVYQMLLRNLSGEREEDVVAASARMESCPICLQAPVYGTRISRPLPNCNHVFHGHCIVRWLMKNKTCPVCHSKVDTS